MVWGETTLEASRRTDNLQMSSGSAAPGSHPDLYCSKAKQIPEAIYIQLTVRTVCIYISSSSEAVAARRRASACYCLFLISKCKNKTNYTFISVQ